MIVITDEKSLYLKKNIGSVDQAIRLMLGAALVIIPALFQWPTWIIALLAAFGGAQIIEGIISY
ncbi:MAG: YgaP family membrane protein [Christensenellales bacterium]